jgi:hypothetical protein
MEIMDPLTQQLSHMPQPALVVCLAELLTSKPMHPVDCIATALARLSPTCRSLWSTSWIGEKLAAASEGSVEAIKEVSALHFKYRT